MSAWLRTFTRSLFFFSPLNKHCLCIDYKLRDDIGSSTLDTTGAWRQHAERKQCLEGVWRQPGKEEGAASGRIRESGDAQEFVGATL